MCGGGSNSRACTRRRTDCYPIPSQAFPIHHRWSQGTATQKLNTQVCFLQKQVIHSTRTSPGWNAGARCQPSQVRQGSRCFHSCSKPGDSGIHYSSAASQAELHAVPRGCGPKVWEPSATVRSDNWSPNRKHSITQPLLGCPLLTYVPQASLADHL